jgi:tetratricopeptide (TPR) repeat protein
VNQDRVLTHTLLRRKLAAWPYPSNSIPDSLQTELNLPGRRIRPVDQVCSANQVSVHIEYWGRDYDRAIDDFLEVLTLEPQFSNAHTRLGVTYLAKGDLGEAVRELETAPKLADTDEYLDGLLGYAEARS